MHDEHKDHDRHDHGHAPPQKDHDAGPMGAYEVLEEAVRSLLVEKGVLTAGEIAGQVMLLLSEIEADRADRPVNVVMMGMGEALHNYDHAVAAVRLIVDPDGIGISRRRVTLSTAGMAPGIRRLAAEPIRPKLAVSLNATTDEVRDSLVPINRKWPIAALLDACRAYPRLSNAERITFEYVMLKGVNDSDADARRLVRLIAGIPAKINLIPFNPWPGAPYQRSDPDRIAAFAAIVNRAGYASPVRTPRGEDIMAACGQLKSASERARRRA